MSEQVRIVGAMGRVGVLGASRRLPLLVAALGLGCEPLAPLAAAPPVVTVAPPALPPPPLEPPPEALPASCGLLEIERDDLVSRRGAGVHHPERERLEHALASCRVDVRAEHAYCVEHVLGEGSALRARYGPAHPAIQRLSIERARCERWFGETLALGREAPRCVEAEAKGEAPSECRLRADTPPTAAQCASWAAARDALRAAGKGRKHPEMLAAEARLATCDARK